MAFDTSGRVVAVVERTNSPAEHCFSKAKRKLRRRLGCASLGRDMQDQPAQAALAANLLDQRCVQVLCGTLDQLPTAFASVGQPCPSHASLGLARSGYRTAPTDPQVEVNSVTGSTQSVPHLASLPASPQSVRPSQV